MRVYEVKEAPGDVVVVAGNVEEAAKLGERADDIVDVNLEKGRAHLLLGDVVITLVVRRPWESGEEAIARALGASADV